MSDMKCPVCNVRLDECGDLLCCPNDHCAWVGNKELWQELIRTRKAFDVAVDEITKIKVAAESVGIGFFITATISALAKIKTALEQKDVK